MHRNRNSHRSLLSCLILGWKPEGRKAKIACGSLLVARRNDGPRATGNEQLPAVEFADSSRPAINGLTPLARRSVAF
jgi:hypothetical protein